MTLEKEHACWVHIMETVLILLAVVALASAVTLLLAKPELGGSGRPTRRRGTSHAAQLWKRQWQCLPAAPLGKRRRSRMRYLRRRHSELNAARRDPGGVRRPCGQNTQPSPAMERPVSDDSNGFTPIARMVRSAAAKCRGWK